MSNTKYDNIKSYDEANFRAVTGVTPTTFNTMLELIYGLTKANVGKTIKWVEEALINSSVFGLPSKRKLVSLDTNIEVIVVDTTETPIQRPGDTKKQRDYYSGKKSVTQ